MKLSTSLALLAVLGLLALAIGADAQTRNQNRGRNRGRGNNRRRGPNCHLKEIDKCMEKMEEIGKRPTASNIITTAEGIEELCSTVEASQACIKGFFKKCGTPIQRELFDFVLEQFTEQVKLFCNDGETRRTFLKHSPCINEKVLTQKSYHTGCVTDIFASIDKGTHLFNKTLDDPNLFDFEKSSARTLSDILLDLTCCSFNRFETCSQTLFSQKCGQEAVDAMRSFTEKTFGSSVKMICPRSLFDETSSECKKILPSHGAKPKGKLSDNPLGKYLLNYMNYIFNYSETVAAAAA